MPISKGAAAAAGSAAGGIAQGIGGKGAAQSAADAQIQAARMAQNTQLSMFNQNRADLEPYRNTGVTALGMLANQYGQVNPLTGAPPTGGNQDQYVNSQNPSDVIAPYLQAFSGGMGKSGYPLGIENALANFKGSPDYNFARQQGILSTNQATNAQGWGGGGGQGRALANYTTGLATQNYGSFRDSLLANANASTNAGSAALTANQAGANQYNAYFNRLVSMAGIGQTATTQTSNLGAAAANNYSQAGLIGGQAQAAGIMGGFNQLAGGFNNAGAYANNYLSSYGNANQPLFGGGGNSLPEAWMG